jgi:hypothetical protein
VLRIQLSFELTVERQARHHGSVATLVARIIQTRHDDGGLDHRGLDERVIRLDS